MIISAPGKFVFIANPKTGTTAIEAQLIPYATMMLGQNPNLKHMNVKRYDRMIAPFLERHKIAPKLDKIAVVRHPVDWLGSWYRYRSRNSLIGHQNSTFGKTYEEFVENYLSETRHDFAKVGSPIGNLMNADGSLGIDLLYAYENISGLARELSERVNAKIEFSKQLNTSPKIELELSKNMQMKLEDYFAPAMEIYENALR